jgi:hypothetical protein
MSNEEKNSKPSSKDRLDDLLQEVKELQERSKPIKERANKKNSIDSIADNIGWFANLIHNFRESSLGVYENLLQPIWSVVGPPFRFVAGIYRKVWNRLAFKTNKKTGERKLSRRRAGLLIGFTVVVISTVTPTALGNLVRFITVEPIFDGILIATSLRKETFYLNSSEEIDPVENIYSVRGCKHEGMCEEKDAVYFRVRPRLSHDIWKFVMYDNPIYVPDHVVAPIAPGVNTCTVTYYGYRMTSSWIARLLRSLQIYPTMLEASCSYNGAAK